MIRVGLLTLAFLLVAAVALHLGRTYRPPPTPFLPPPPPVAGPSVEISTPSVPLGDRP